MPESAGATLGERPAVRGCVKCGGDDLLIRWHGAGAYHRSRTGASCHSDYGEWHGNPTGEHLHVTCRTCQFDWFEDTLDNLGGES